MIAYHGTSKESGEKIKRENSYKFSCGDNQWLGTGAYFFIDSIYSESPIEDAKCWAQLEAYDKDTKSYTYNEYSVIKNFIEGQLDIWDLSSEDGAEFFLLVKNSLAEKIYTNSVQKKLKKGPSDGIVINYAIEKIKNICYNIVKNNVYIQLTKVERLKRVRYCQPNCTALAVRDTSLVKIKDICEEGTCYE